LNNAIELPYLSASHTHLRNIYTNFPKVSVLLFLSSPLDPWENHISTFFVCVRPAIIFEFFPLIYSRLI